MAFSVNTNAGALVALQNLNKTNASLETTQTRINTGLKVSGAKDNSAIFAIAQSLRADLGGLAAVQTSLDRASSSADVALAAAEAVSDLLIEMKGIAVTANDNGIDADSRTSLNNDFEQLKAQITSIIENAEFNGINAVNGSDDIIAITDVDASSLGQISLGSIDLTLATLGLDDQSVQGANRSAASAALDAISAAMIAVAADLSTLGAGAKRLAIQKDFTVKLSDSIEIGIGNLVDADMAKESATLQSLQVKQQLGLQALSIANQAPGAVLTLFQ